MPHVQNETNARRHLLFNGHQRSETPGIGSLDDMSLDFNVGKRTNCGGVFEVDELQRFGPKRRSSVFYSVRSPMGGLRGFRGGRNVSIKYEREGFILK